MQREKSAKQRKGPGGGTQIYADHCRRRRLWSSAGDNPREDAQHYTRGEAWRAVPGYGGLYEVSSFGKVKSLNYKNTGYPRDLKLTKSDGRYFAVKLSKHGAAKDHKVHLLVLDAFRGRKPEGLEGNHEDGDTLNNRLDNLRYRTKSYNERHKHAMGLVSMAGVNNPNSRLTQYEIDSIPHLVESGVKVSEIAKQLDVTESTVYLKLRKTRS